MTESEIIETAKRLGCPVPMVDDRPIPPNVRYRALRIQAQAFADELNRDSRTRVATAFSGGKEKVPMVGIGSMFVLERVWTIQDLRALLLDSASLKEWRTRVLESSHTRA